jgi:uncharacterized membrane protein
MKSILERLKAFFRSFTVPGLLLGTLFFAASLTPSLVPRGVMVQATVSGVAFASGYGVGVAFLWLWRYLQLPVVRGLFTVKLAAAGACLATAGWFLWRASEWQNSTRLLMQLPAVESGRPVTVGLLALAIFLALALVARLFALVFRMTSRRLTRHVPKRVSNLIAFGVAAALFVSVGNGLILNAGLRMADEVYRKLDLLIEDHVAQPLDPMRTGSPGSLIGWDGLGRAGRGMVAAGPSREDIEAFTGATAREPIRVYVGLNSDETPQARARLALQELKRVAAFDRSVVVITMPTGTGWIDPESQPAVEYLHRGDIATVSVQYSYLASWLALLVDPDYGAETANALFDEVYGYWATLPRESRPRLYLHGLSLGSLNSDQSADLFKVIGDPFDGAFWVGPPFSSPTWNQVTAARRPGSPAWLPRFRNGSLIRFTAQQNHLEEAEADWGAMRIVYLQYASDPVTFFDPAALYRAPAWMIGPRGPDVSPDLTWYPIVTLIQLVLDMATSTSTPTGYGHVYAAEHYIDGWVAVTRPPGWNADDIARLKAMLASRRE